ncbi:Major facilitator superfamily domain, general substrate transporter [Pseudocohnilembus persalinus]|uniref:Major facilitator superfamily domain, general substrate transporter n=1 Tax=Pseudocohnilembus persalinus TaxID=266149 RepID=A0A0V0R1P5_PSEPJ|nr:Major facilitator superfamily domain, general substrate transporter [Pseudocohnilembus persalinus]|eukprot:KRX08085.1 Major facilitator superfamily domain, general substrate transporter [Pseudocohnilembus persalinus]
MANNSQISYNNIQNDVQNHNQRKFSNQSYENNIKNVLGTNQINQKESLQTTDKQTNDQQIRFRQNQSSADEDKNIYKNEKQHNDNLKKDKVKQNVNYDTVLTLTGFGNYQFAFYLIMIFLGMAEGSQISIFTLLIPILKNEWQVHDFLNSFSASVVFVGALFGSLLAGKFSDKYGRRTPFMYSTGMTVFLQLFQAFCLDIYQLIIVRGILGVLVGFFGPLGVTFTSEFTPSQNRGRYMSIIQVSIAIGQMFGLLIGYLTLDGNLQFGHWRILIIICSVPGIMAWLGGYFFLDESPLFCLANKQYDKCFEILERINIINGQQNIQQLDETMKTQLVQWSKNSHKQQQTGSIKDLYQGKYKQVTLIIWANWFSIMFVYYGIVLMMPYILSKMPPQESSSITNNDITMLGIQGVSDMIGAAIASYLIEIPGFGRTNNMIINLLISGFVSIILYYYQGYQLFLIATIDRFFLSLTTVFAYQFTSEVYPTHIRTTGVGTANAVGKVGGF